MDSTKKIVIAGGTGYLGEALAKYFSKQGMEVVIIGRNISQNSDNQLVKYMKWDGENLGDWAESLENAEALINMAGRSVNCRYTEKNKQQIYDSRLKSTAILGKAIQNCQKLPQVWLNSSSATIYRHALDRPMDEIKGEIGSGFSVDVCQKWEAVFNQAQTPQTRKIVLRTAMVLGKSGGVFPYMQRLVRFGWGGKQGVGNQFISWIHEIDFCQIIQFLIENEQLDGVFNLSSPDPRPNTEFMRLLRQKMSFPFALGATEWMVKLGAKIIGSEAELLLKSRRVIPTRLLNLGYQFKFANLEEGLADLVKKM
jgi:uncharacterized protein (TIGR01777 family)